MKNIGIWCGWFMAIVPYWIYKQNLYSAISYFLCYYCFCFFQVSLYQNYWQMFYWSIFYNSAKNFPVNGTYRIQFRQPLRDNVRWWRGIHVFICAKVQKTCVSVMTGRRGQTCEGQSMISRRRTVKLRVGWRRHKLGWRGWGVNLQQW